MKKAGITSVLTLIVLIITLATVSKLTYARANNSSTAQSAEEDALIDSLKQTASLCKSNVISFTKETKSSKLDKNAAIENAKKELGGVGNGITDIKTAHVRYTMNYVDKLPNGLIPKNEDAWIVSFNGISIPSDGPKLLNAPTPVYMFHQVNVVIDANTGQRIEVFLN